VPGGGVRDERSKVRDRSGGDAVAQGAAEHRRDAESGAESELGELGRGLEPVEVFMRKMSHDPHCRSTSLAIYLLDRTPDWDRLVQIWDRVSRLVPRFRQRLVDPPLGFPSRWVMDPDFDLDYHVRRIRASEPGTLRQVFDMGRTMLMADLDPDRPLWEVTLIEGLEGGRAALVQKADHTIGDGQGGMRVMQILLDQARDADPGPMPPEPEPEEVAPAAVLRATFAERLRAAGSSDPQRVGRFVGAVAGALLRPRRTVSGVLGFAASAGRIVSPATTPRSPLLQGRSLSYHFDALEVDLDDLRRAGKAVGGTINDCFLAALAGALGRYHERLGSPLEHARVGMPISTRTDGDALASNHFSAAFLAAPAGVADPAARIRQVHEQVRQARSEPALAAIDVALPYLRLLPDAVVQTVVSAGIPDVSASSIPGFDIDLYMAGAKIERMYGFGPTIGGAMLIGLVSMFGVCCVTLNLDPAAFTEPDLLVDCLQEAFEEILDLGGSHAGVRTPTRSSAGTP
jgi:diacylglycerol O-acyltransferase